MKKIIVLLAAACIACSLSVTAYAAPDPTPSTAVSETAQPLGDKAAEYREFRAALMEKRIRMLENKTANLVLRQENLVLRNKIRASIKSIRDDGGTIPEDTASALKAYTAQIKALTDELRQTKGQIKTLMEPLKEVVKAKDYARMDSIFADVYAVQTLRNEKLRQINEILKQMEDLLVE